MGQLFFIRLSVVTTSRDKKGHLFLQICWTEPSRCLQAIWTQAAVEVMAKVVVVNKPDEEVTTTVAVAITWRLIQVRQNFRAHVMHSKGTYLIAQITVKPTDMPSFWKNYQSMLEPCLRMVAMCEYQLLQRQNIQYLSHLLLLLPKIQLHQWQWNNWINGYSTKGSMHLSSTRPYLMPTSSLYILLCLGNAWIWFRPSSSNRQLGPMSATVKMESPSWF